MNNISHYDHAKFAMGRFDQYLNIVNSKGSFYVALNTFLLGGLFTGVTAIYRQINHPPVIWWLLSAFAVCSLVSIICTILAINPYLNSGNRTSAHRSLLFFGSVQGWEKAAHEKTFMDQDDARMLHDTISQSWVLSCGLVSKYHKLRIAGFLLITQFLLLPFIIYCIISNLK